MADRRKYVGRAAAVLLAAIVVTVATGCGDGGAGEAPAPDSSPRQSTPGAPATATHPAVLACGAQFTPPTGGGLYLTGRFPAAAAASGGTVAGTVEVKSPRPVRGVVGRHAEVFLVRDGRVATVPGVQDSAGVLLDLGSSEAHEMPGSADLTSCAALTPGTYQVYARVGFVPDGSTARTDSYGGPWPIELT